MRLLLRALFIQALINYRWMQGNAFRYALRQNRPEDLPVIPFFNTHPWLAPGVVALAERLRRSGRPNGEIEEVKLRWMGPLGSVGDSVFWSTVRPASILAAMAVLLIEPRAFWVIPCAFALFSLFVRWQAIHAGMQGEDAFYRWLEKMQPQRVIQIGRRFLPPLQLGVAAAVAAGLVHRFAAAGRGRLVFVAMALVALWLKNDRRIVAAMVTLGVVYAWMCMKGV